MASTCSGCSRRDARCPGVKCRGRLLSIHLLIRVIAPSGSYSRAAVHDVLHIGINVSWKVVIQESLGIGVLHDQILLCFTDRVTFVQHFASTITETMRKHRMKPSMNLAETSQSSRHSTLSYRLFPLEDGLSIDYGRLAKEIAVFNFRFQRQYHLLPTILNEQSLKLFHRGKLPEVERLQPKKGAKYECMGAEDE